VAVKLLALCCVAALAVAASASAATTKRANACLKAHHVVIGPRSAKEVTVFGVRLLHYEGFSFIGRPPTVYDNGSLIFNRSHAAALRARAKLNAGLLAAAVAQGASPSPIEKHLAETHFVIGTVVVLWNDHPQTRIARTILARCLR
jgi:hypothetical protein